MLACPEHVSDKSRMGGGFRALRGPTPHEQNASLKCGVLAKHRYHLSKSPCETNPAMPHHAVPFVCVCVCVRVRGCLYLQLFVFACGISRTYIYHIVCVYIYIYSCIHTCIHAYAHRLYSGKSLPRSWKSSQQVSCCFMVCYRMLAKASRVGRMPHRG